MTHPSQPPPTPGREEPDWLKRAREIAADHMQPATDLAFARRTIEAYDLGFEAGQSSRPGGEGEAHASDCAVNNGPAYPAGPCDCGFAPVYPRALERAVEALERIKVATPNSTNSATAERMATWTIGVATEALASLSTIPEASGWRPDRERVLSVLIEASSTVRNTGGRQWIAADIDRVADAVLTLFTLPPGEQP